MRRHSPPCGRAWPGDQAVLDDSARSPAVTLAAGASTSRVTVAITDSGGGVAQTLKDKIFQPFYTTKSEGTGVGLSFARQVPLSHGGDLVLQEPRNNAGATFIFRLDR
ncbi:MAG: ATP-binding protein [Caulobacteraceae bacterium]